MVAAVSPEVRAERERIAGHAHAAMERMVAIRDGFAPGSEYRNLVGVIAAQLATLAKVIRTGELPQEDAQC